MQYYTDQTQKSLVESTYNLYVNASGKRRLPDTFEPGQFDVICARGKAAHNSEGNVRFRALVGEYATQYKTCTCKYEKSKIVSHIVNTVRKAAAYHNGGFVKNVDRVAWYEVGDRAAKEKIGQTFRDLLHTKYSSSTKAKARARIQKRVDEYDGDSDEELNVEGNNGSNGSNNHHTNTNANANHSSQARKAAERLFAPIADIHIPTHFSIMPEQMQFPKLDSWNPASMFTGGGGHHIGGNISQNNNTNNSQTGTQQRMAQNSAPVHPGSSLTASKSIRTLASSTAATTTKPISPNANHQHTKRFQPLSESILLDTLRSSVQTVELPDDMSRRGSSFLDLSGQTTDWMKGSILSRGSLLSRGGSVQSMPKRDSTMSAMSMNSTPFSTASSPFNVEDMNSSHFNAMVDDLNNGNGGGFDNDGNGSVLGDRYGIFSSSTRSNPFCSSLSRRNGGPKTSPTNPNLASGADRTKRTSVNILRASANSRQNPLLAMSNTSRASLLLESTTMDLDMDGLLDSMDSMGFQMMIDN